MERKGARGRERLKGHGKSQKEPAMTAGERGGGWIENLVKAKFLCKKGAWIC